MRARAAASRAPGAAAGGPRVELALAFALAAALVCWPWRGHVDDVDAQLYQVVARHLALDRAWLSMRYLPGVLPQFREHLPFGFWPAALAIRAFGERAIGPAYALFTLGAVGCAAWLAARLGGPRAAVGAAIALGTCESIWQYGGRLLLDPPLMFFATAAAACVLIEQPRWALAALFAALAALVKGPFGLLPLCTCVLARAWVERDVRFFARGALAALCACAPAAAFLAWDRAALGGTYWRGYLLNQLLASASGARGDGVAAWWFPLSVIAGRFWPGLPFAAIAAARARTRPRERVVALACAAMALLLCLPHRKWGNHSYVAFPLFAVLAGLGAAPLLEAVFARAPRALRWTLAGSALLAWLLALTGLGARVLRPPCPSSRELAAGLDGVPSGAAVAVVSPRIDWLTLGELSAERDLVPWPVTSLPESGYDLAVAHDGYVPVAGWRETARARGLAVLRRR